MKYDAAHIEPILKALREGAGRTRAVKSAGIDYSTFLEWLIDDRKPEFRKAVLKAEHDGADLIKDLCTRRVIEDKSWQSAAWWLERKFSDEFKNRSEIGATDGFITVNFRQAKPVKDKPDKNA